MKNDNLNYGKGLVIGQIDDLAFELEGARLTQEEKEILFKKSAEELLIEYGYLFELVFDK